MKRTKISEMDEFFIEFNRARYRGELSQAIYELMRKNRVKRSELADMLGVSRSRISHLLSGHKNIKADTLADALLVLGRTPHVTLSTHFDEIRFPIDEADIGNTVSASTTSNLSFKLTEERHGQTTKTRLITPISPDRRFVKGGNSAGKIVGRIGSVSANVQYSRANYG